MPPIIILAVIMCGTVVVVSAMAVVSRYISQRPFVGRSLTDEEIARRLERIEQAVDATAIEVERLAESTRFVAKLLAERSSVR